RVGVRGLEERDPKIESGVDHPQRLILGGSAGDRKQHPTEPHHADLRALGTQLTHLHRAGLYQRPQDISPPKFITIYISFVFCDRSVAKMTCSSPRSPGGQKTFRKKPTRDTLSPEAV